MTTKTTTKTTTKPTTSNKKALIIGCGIAGPVAAMFLKRAGIDAVIYEAQSAAMDHAGAFLNLSPNGINVLRTLGIDEQVEAAGFPCNGIVFWNNHGKRIGELDMGAEQERYGAGSIVIKRGLLNKALREEALGQGIQVEFGKKLARIEVTGEQVVIAHFEDGTQARGDFLIGCDGIHSRTRQLMLPDAPKPKYTGMLNCGGFTRCAAVSRESDVMHMTFGKRAFFGYFATPSGEIYWFNNTSQPQEPTRDELKHMSADTWRQRLLALHSDDPAAIQEIIRSTDDPIGTYVDHDIPFLPTWHQGPVCLIGDAAHATSPHVGQGASMALEDALVLAKCLRDIPDLEQAFARYQSLRKERVETLIRQARRTGNQKAVSNPIMLWIRDRILPFFIERSARSSAWVYSYNVDWNEVVA